VSADDLVGRRIGAEVGRAAWALARLYLDGSVSQSPVNLTVRRFDNGTCEVRCDTLRGLFYKLQSTPDLTQPFTDDPGGFRPGGRFVIDAPG